MKGETRDERQRCEEQFDEGTGHIKFGVGVGVASAVSLAIIGTTCPLCFFVAPAMVAAGVHKRRQAKRDLESMDCADGDDCSDRGEDGTPDLTINWGNASQ